MAVAKPRINGHKGAPRAKQQPEKLELVERHTLADSVYAQLRTAIVRGQLRDGAKLKQVELAEQLGVSRVPVREALRRLQAEHLVAAEPFQCFVVTTLTRPQVMELIDLREELEVIALKQSLKSPDLERRIREAKAAAKALSLSQDDQSWLASDRDFHRALNGGTTAVTAIIEDIRERVHRYLYSAPAVARRRSGVLKEHAALLAAFQAGDEQAVEDAIRRHVRGTRKHLEQSDVDVGPSEVDSSATARLDIFQS